MNRRTRNILIILGWLLLGSYLVYSLLFTAERAKKVLCRGIRVEVVDSAQYQFVKPGTIRKMILSSTISPIGKPLNSINTHKLEKNISELVAVRDVQVYKSMDGILRITVKQRRPIVRIFNARNQSYYIDDEGLVMPVSSSYAAYVLIASGNIYEPFRVKPNIDITRWNDSLTNGSKPLVCQIFDFARYINHDAFWRAQINQIYVINARNVELIPVVGPHVIAMGSLEGYDRKLKKLKLFYENALPTEGWNKYSRINLMYSNQIVCTKR
ncbi:MAG TPA: hypothetical protein PKO42_01065 [Tenuifilaceae bacterium]|nr:hypothetical protein [Tenuifilaceae bacterium]HOA10134.1 hypothetical protein [Tenuifilaceae bacterium]HOC37148.1 hypothetical protein [Tenuifilaceae bacterium]HOG72836.1 hypothetical protein [Tenuifilaceae bacterium]HOY71693.1 hypothetical protein [Tenuifilaceae bacterium]